MDLQGNFLCRLMATWPTASKLFHFKWVCRALDFFRLHKLLDMITLAIDANNYFVSILTEEVIVS